MFYPRKYIRAIRLGIKSLLLHKMRAILTMLGIIFGVCSVIAMLAIGEGASYEAQESIRKLGSTNIILTSVKPPEDQQNNSDARSWLLDYGMTYKDVGRILTTIPNVKQVLPMRILLDDVMYAGNKRQCQIIGTLPTYATLRSLKMARGRFLTDLDLEHANNACVISAALAKALFPFQDPLQEAVRIKSDYYRVVGVLEPNSVLGRVGSAGQGNTSYANELYIPLSTSRAEFGENIFHRASGSFSAERVELHEVIVQMDDMKHVEQAAGAIERLLKRFHKKRDYAAKVPLEQLIQAQKTKRIFNIVLGSIAAISLLVGGIGIMNIMLATVTERTREIGIRRALGARKRDITVQFLVETVVLSIGGGLIGVGLGLLIPIFVSHVTDIKTIVTTWSLVVAFGISGVIGIVFGLYPAKRAADLDPIEALRHE